MLRTFFWLALGTVQATTSTTQDELKQIDDVFGLHGATAATALVQRALVADPRCVGLLFRQSMMDIKQERFHSAELYADRAAELVGDAAKDTACWMEPGAIKFAKEQAVAKAMVAPAKAKKAEGEAALAAPAAAEVQPAAEVAAKAAAASGGVAAAVADLQAAATATAKAKVGAAKARAKAAVAAAASQETAEPQAKAKEGVAETAAAAEGPPGPKEERPLRSYLPEGLLAQAAAAAKADKPKPPTGDVDPEAARKAWGDSINVDKMKAAIRDATMATKR